MEHVENSPADSAPSSGTGPGALVNGAAKPAGKTRTRSQATSGRRVFVEGDGNSRWARRYRDLIAAHCQDMGGTDLLSEAQLSLIRRASAIELELEQMEGKLSMGEQVDLDVFTRSASHLRRLFETLGFERKCRDVTLNGEVEALPWSPLRERARLARAKEIEAEAQP
jgi:hypothetical protein